MLLLACWLLPAVAALNATVVAPACATLEAGLQEEVPNALALLQHSAEARAGHSALLAQVQKAVLSRGHSNVVLWVSLSLLGALLLGSLASCMWLCGAGKAENFLEDLKAERLPERKFTQPDLVPSAPLLLKPEAMKALARSRSETTGMRSDVFNYGPRNIFRANAPAMEEQRRLTPTLSDMFDSREDGKVGQGEAIYNIVNILAGSSLLTLPYGFNVAGWAAGGVLLGATAVLTFTGVLIGATLDMTSDELTRQAVDEESRDFATLALLASGPRVRDLIGFFFSLELFMAVVSFFINIAINTSLVTGLPRSLVIVLSGVVSLALTRVSMRALAYVSAASLLTIAIAAAALLWSGVAMPSEPAASHAILQVRGLPCALGLVLFSFAGHPCLPSVYWSMRQRSQFRMACFVGFLISMAFYGIVAALSYYYYGSQLQKVFTANLGRDLSGHSLHGLQFLQLLTAAAFAIKLQGSLPLVIGPVTTVLENSLGLGPEDRCSKLTVKVLAVAAAAVLALFFQEALDVVCSIGGSALTMTTSVIFPCWLYWQLVPVHGCLMRVALLATIVAGFCFAIYGTMDAVRSFAA